MITGLNDFNLLFPTDNMFWSNGVGTFFLRWDEVDGDIWFAGTGHPDHYQFDYYRIEVTGEDGTTHTYYRHGETQTSYPIYYVGDNATYTWTVYACFTYTPTHADFDIQYNQTYTFSTADLSLKISAGWTNNNPVVQNETHSAVNLVSGWGVYESVSGSNGPWTLVASGSVAGGPGPDIFYTATNYTKYTLGNTKKYIYYKVESLNPQYHPMISNVIRFAVNGGSSTNN